MADWKIKHGRRLRELDKLGSLPGQLPGLTLSFAQDDLVAFREQLREFPGIFSAAAQEAVEQTRKRLRRDIRNGLKTLTTLQPAYISRAVRSSRTKRTSEGARAEIRIASRRLPLIRYDVDPVEPPQLEGLAVSARKRVDYRLRKGGKTYGDTSKAGVSGASSLFVQALKSGHVGVFYRVGKGGNGKIMEEYGPNVQYHMYADGFAQKLERGGQREFLRSLAAEVHALCGVEVKL